MKKVLFFILTLTLCLFAVNFENQKVSANSESTGDLISSKTEYFEDGSYLVTTYSTIKENTNTRSDTRVVLHTVTVTQYSALDTVLWIYELTGGWFVNDGVSVQAQSSVAKRTINSNAWHFTDGESTYYGTIVHGEAVFEHKLLGITTKTVTIDINLECDVYGNLIEQ